MTPSALKFAVDATGSHFFNRDNMEFFGDTMANYGVRSATIFTRYDTDGNYVPGGLEIEAWELYRKRPVKNGLQNSHFFDKKTFKLAHGGEKV